MLSHSDLAYQSGRKELVKTMASSSSSSSGAGRKSDIVLAQIAEVHSREQCEES